MYHPIQDPEHRTSSEPEPAPGSLSPPPPATSLFPPGPTFLVFQDPLPVLRDGPVLLTPQHRPDSPDAQNPPCSGSPSPKNSQLWQFSKHKVCSPGLSCPAVAVPYCLLTTETSRLCSDMAASQPHPLKQTPPASTPTASKPLKMARALRETPSWPKNVLSALSDFTSSA